MSRLSAVAPLLAAASGLTGLVAHPPVGWWPTTFLAPGLLVAALWVDALAARRVGRGVRAFRLGALAGTVTFAPMLSWLILPAGFLGWFLLVAVQVLWFGLLAVLLRPVLEHRLLPLAAAVVWTGVDAWRSLIPLNGFEWGAIAYAHVDGSWLLPVARLVGGRGITFLVVLISVAAAIVVRVAARELAVGGVRNAEQALSTTRWPLAWLVGGLLVSVLATVEPPEEIGTLDVLAVQGNDLRHWEDGVEDPDPPLRITTALRDETLAAVEEDGAPQLTVWPESSVDRDPWAERGRPLGELADEVAAEVGTLLTGATLDAPDDRSERYVAALLLQDGLHETDRYVKRRLVPFGEYIPFRPWLEWFPPLDQIPRDARSGSSPQTVEVADGVLAAVVICFETLFTDIVRTNVLADDDPAQVVLTLTNDASFGDSAEPAQHLAQSRLRAVETGRWVVHAALSGSSAFVDPDGVAHQETAVFTVESIRAGVPLVEGLTPFLVTGDLVGTATRAASLLAVLLLPVGWWRQRRAGDGSALSLPSGSEPGGGRHGGSPRHEEQRVGHRTRGTAR